MVIFLLRISDVEKKYLKDYDSIVDRFAVLQKYSYLYVAANYPDIEFTWPAGRK